MRQPAQLRPTKDLFGSVPVSLEDVELWLYLVPKIPRTSPIRREYYLQHYDVVNKIQRAKLSGDFYLMLDSAASAEAPSRLAAVLAACSR